jgi:NitT/TauT family transport system substrate-binding protein
MLASTVVAAGVAGCDRAGGRPSGLTPVTVQLAWLHQAQSAGFYVADRRGYYAEEGVAVRLLDDLERAR